MGTILRHGSEEQKERYLPRIASGELRLQAFGVTEPTAGSDTTSLQTTATKVDGGWSISGQKIWTSRARALRPDAPPRADDARRAGREADRRALDVHRRHEAGRRRRDDDDPPDPHADEPRDDRDLLRRRRGRRRRPRRRGGQGVPLHPRRDERRARPDRGGVHRRRPLVRREGDRLRERARRLRAADRREPGRAVPDRAGPRADSRRRT